MVSANKPGSSVSRPTSRDKPNSDTPHSILWLDLRALTLYIQKDSPGKARESSWLPALNGPIYLVMRLYWPSTESPSILPPGEGTWKPPAVVVASK